MLKRTKGRILLTLLVITGLAGTVNNTSLSNQERKSAISHLKESRTDLLNKIKGLSKSQLDFKSFSQNQSIRECFYQLVWTEKLLWDKLEEAMKKPATPEKRSELKLSDKDILAIWTDPDIKNKTDGFVEYSNIKWKSIAETAAIFKSLRSEQLKYIKNTTSDLRNRFIRTPRGWVDCYQYILFIAAHSDFQLKQIHEILSQPGFPQN